MTEQECLSRMVVPGQYRPLKGHRGGVIQIHLTRSCNLACFNCTQGSDFGGKTTFMTVEQFNLACLSLKRYWGIVGVFGGNPATHPQFVDICAVLRKHFPKERCGLWCNDIMAKEKAEAARQTFDVGVSNLNVHLDCEAYQRFRDWWPESRPFGLQQDSRHAPVFVAMKDVLRKPCGVCGGTGRGITWADDGDKCETCKGTGQVYDESRAWELISGCDINQRWSALIGTFRGELRAWFCEVAGAQAMLHQDEPDYPDTGLDPTSMYEIAPPFYGHGTHKQWWDLPIRDFADQVRKHCHECGVPLRGYGELSQEDDEEGVEQVSATHAGVAKPKRRHRAMQTVTSLEQLGMGRLRKFTDYLQNAVK